jgi:CBS domain-containing protein
MIKAKDIMTRMIITVSPETDITEAAKILLEHHFNGLPVIDSDGRLVGIISQSDLITLQKKIRLPSVFTLLDTFIPIRSQKSFDQEMSKIAAAKVGDAMTPDPVCIDPELDLEEIATLMVEKDIHTLPVVEGGRLIGIIGKEDVLTTIIPNRREE